jgi:hypothetical protein
MKVYISLPVTSREEKTRHEQVEAAKKRVEFLKGYLDNFVSFGDNPEFVSVFDLDYSEDLTEAVILGRCVTAVLDCDAIYVDLGWRNSKGCTLEYLAARTYQKRLFDMDEIQ